MADKEHSGAFYIKWFTILATVVGILATVYYTVREQGEDRKDIETRLFTDNTMKVKTEEWVNSPRNEVELYKVATANLEQGELYLQGKRDFDSAFVFIRSVLENDIEDKLNRIASRKTRDSLAKISTYNDSISTEEIKFVKRELRNYGNDLSDILEEIKKIKDTSN